MRGTHIQKLVRLARSLVQRPEDVGRYFSMRNQTPIELALPWFSFAAIDFLESHLKQTMRVFEYGIGGSTLFFSQRCLSVVSTEDNKDWIDSVTGVISNLNNVVIQLRAIDAAKFATCSYLDSIVGEFDVISIDGMGWDKDPFRVPCLLNAEKHVAPGGIIVLDDAWRYPEARTLAKAKDWREFKSTGPYRPGVTTTEIFFY